MLTADSHSFISTLTAPLEGDAATGTDLRRDASPDSLYFRLRDARARARAAERATEYEPDAAGSGETAWTEVSKLASEALAHKAKDLEIAAWLTEGLVRSNGLRGLAAGSQILANLISNFWDVGLHPLPDEDGMEGRLAPVGGLSGGSTDGTLLQPLRKIALFDRTDGAPLKVWQFELAESTAGAPPTDKPNKSRASNIPSFAEIEGEAQAGGRTALSEVGQQAELALKAWQDLEAALDKVADRASPPMRRVSDLLRKIIRISLRYAPRPAMPAVPAEPHEDLRVAPLQDAPPAPRPHADAMDREALLQEIARIAALFRQREPNSPISFTLDNAVRRARLAWPDLLREMLPELAPRAAVLTGLGIVPTPE